MTKIYKNVTVALKSGKIIILNNPEIFYPKPDILVISNDFYTYNISTDNIDYIKIHKTIKKDVV